MKTILLLQIQIEHKSMPDKLIPNYDGLYGDVTGRYSSEYIFLELIATRSQTFDWLIKPHIHTHLFQVFVVENGSFLLLEATKQQQLQAPCIVLIPPTLLHGLVYSPNVGGKILTLSEHIIEDIFKTSIPIWQTFQEIQILHQFDEILSFEHILTVIKKIEEELFSEQAERATILRAYLAEFFIKLHRMSKQDEVIAGNSQMMTYYRKFQKSIKNSDQTKTIPEFATELNITPVHLNRICKAVSGKSAIALVQQNLVSEAQKYLLHTSYSVSEIAYLLKFEYPNYFAKLFKKHTGLSPVAFRQKGRK